MAQITDVKEHGWETQRAIYIYIYIILSEKLCYHNGAFLHLKYDPNCLMISGCTMTDMSQLERKKYGPAPECAVKMQSWGGGLENRTVADSPSAQTKVEIKFKDHSVEN